jgi:hypothetical protein
MTVRINDRKKEPLFKHTLLSMKLARQNAIIMKAKPTTPPPAPRKPRNPNHARTFTRQETNRVFRALLPEFEKADAADN